MFTESDLKKVLDNLDICRKGQCWHCEYYARQCTDTLIDDCFELLKSVYYEMTGQEYD